MPTLNSINGSVATGTRYLKADGTLTTTATDLTTWQRRTVNEPVWLQGAFAGGTTVVTLEESIGPDAAWAIWGESANVAASLANGVAVDARQAFYRVKIVQSGAAATDAYLTASG
jgi:hypothetical protein